MAVTRRSLLAAGALGPLAYALGGRLVLLSPREARARGAELRMLSEAQARALAALAERLVPGAAEAGLVHFVDAQLGAAPADCLLTIRYLDVPPPWTPLYRSALDAVDEAAERMAGAAFADLDPEVADAVVAKLQSDALSGWSGPPAPLVYFVLRSDAVDATYGTAEGFARLGIDYRAHLPPERPW